MVQAAHESSRQPFHPAHIRFQAERHHDAFKAYRASVINGRRPILSPHFNLTVELPLKTIVGAELDRNSGQWRNRLNRRGERRVQSEEMGSRYLWSLLGRLVELYSVE